MHFRRRMAKVLSREAAAEELGVSVRTVDRMRQEGELVTVAVRGRRLILAASVEAHLERAGERTGATAREPADSAVGSGRLPIKVIDERRRHG